MFDLFKKVNIGIFMVLLLLVVPRSAPAPATVLPQETLDGWTTGSLGGVNWAYGAQTYTASGNASRVDEGLIQEEYRNEVSENVSLELLMSANYSNSYWRMQQVFTSPSFAENYTEEQWFNDSSFSDWVYFVNVTLADSNDPSNFTHGQELLNLYINDSYSLEETIYVDQNEKFLGTTFVNTTYFEYDFLYSDANYSNIWVHAAGIVFQRVVILDVVYQQTDVMATRTRVSAAYVGYHQEFARAYNVTAQAHQVVINNGSHLEMTFTMYDSIEANYTEYVVSWMQYALVSVDYTELKYLNGTAVPWENYPRHLLPTIYKTNGTLVEAGYTQSRAKLLSTYQGITSQFATVDAEANDTAASINARLAIWAVQLGTNLIAYEDANGDGKLNLGFDRDGLKVASDDRVTHIGLTEAYHKSTYSAYYSQHLYNESLQMPGFGVDVSVDNVNDTSFEQAYDTYDIGDVRANTTTSFTWTDPTMNDNGTVHFDFGVAYHGFPVTWISTFDGTTVTDGEEIAYNYKVDVNPKTGYAKISPTWTYGGVTDAGLAATMAGKSLATIVKSEFFAVMATYTATETNSTLNSTTTTTFGRVGIRVGNGTATEIDVEGPKQFYTSGGNNHTASFETLNLIQVAGSFSAERTTPFDSESDDTAGTASNAVVETLNVEFFYSASLVVISYPTWGGDAVVHDPDYNVNFQPTPDAEPTSTLTSPPTSPPSSNTSSPTSSSTPTSTPTSSSTPTSTPTSSTPAPATSQPPASPAAPSPGFAGITSIVAFATLVVFLRKRK